jgi:hypothetical protein
MRCHTKILTHAIAWERAGFDRKLLLRGADAQASRARARPLALGLL